ncbi:MAG: hypothetical protein K6A65_07190, partial [Succinivibrionaceae bacterium]|nr:hypothetical protein [Succinivibrionaceae bacterium]
PVRRGATDAEIFATCEELGRRQQELGLVGSRLDMARQLVEKTRCCEIPLIVSMAAHGQVNQRAEALCSPGRLGKAANLAPELYAAQGAIDNMVRATGHTEAQVLGVYADAMLESMTPAQIREMVDTLASPATKPLLQALNSAAHEDERVGDADRQGKDPDFYRGLEDCPRMRTGLELLGELYARARERLGEQPAALIDPGVAGDIFSLPPDSNDVNVFRNLMPHSYSEMEFMMFMLNPEDRPSAEDRRILNDFYKGLSINAGQGRPTTMGAYHDRANLIPITYIGPHGDQEETEWSPEHFAQLMAGRCPELLDLLRRTGGHPSAAEVWAVMRPGKPAPAGLGDGNLVESIMRSVITEGAAFNALVGKSYFDPMNHMGTLFTISGLTIDRLVSIMGNCQHEDIVLDQATLKAAGMLRFSSTMFSESADGSMFAKGDHSHGFGMDFVRTVPPLLEPGAPELANPLFSLTVENGPTFTGTEYFAQGSNERKAEYLSGIAQGVRGICSTDRQLSGVAVATGQLTEGSLRLSGYRAVSPGMEHSALDYVVRPLDNGNVEVKISEKPGSLVKFRHTYEVDPQGHITLREGRTTLPSLDKIAEYNRTHAEKIL